MTLDVGFAYNQFETYWKNREYTKAISIYHIMGRPFCWTEDIADYYMRIGKVSAAMVEYQYLVDEYLRISSDFLPLPQGPRELFLLGRWYARKDKAKAQKYLELYLSAETKCGSDPAFYLRHKNAAQRILNKL